MATIRIFRHYVPLVFLMLGFFEGAVLLAGFYIGVEIRFWDADPATIAKVLPIWPKGLVFVAVVLLSMAGMGLYERRMRDGIEGVLLRTAAGFALSLVPLAVVFYLFPELYLGRGALAIAYLVGFIGVAVLRWLFLKFGSQETLLKRVLVLGTGNKAAMIRKLRRRSDLRGLRIVGYVRMGSDEDVVDPEVIIDLDQPLVEWVRDHEIDEIVLAVDDRRKGLPVKEILDCKMSGVDVQDLLNFFERETGKIKLDILNPSWLFFSDGFQYGPVRASLKRVLDVAVVLLMLPLALPLMILVGVAILAESGGRGPIFFTQMRVGQNGRPFRILKFRSMRTDAEKEGAKWATANDPRVTRVGRIIRKVRLDELPQLLNILKGDMSFVGPRPEQPAFVDQLAERIPYYNERHRVKPGLTGWAQVCYQYGDSDEDAFEKLQYDLYYVKNYSILLDMLILVQTVEVVLMGKGAH